MTATRHRLHWYACVILAIYACSSLAQRTWTRFQQSPTVITMDRNKLEWNTSFPTLTVCPHKRIDELKVEAYMAERPQRFAGNATLRADFHRFVGRLANWTYASIDGLPMDGDDTFGVRSDDYLALVWNLTWVFQPDVSSGAGTKMYLTDVVTELGICYTFNSKISSYMSYK